MIEISNFFFCFFGKKDTLLKIKVLQIQKLIKFTSINNVMINTEVE